MGGDTEVAQAGLPPIPPGFEIEKKPAAVAREKTALPPIPPGFQIETKPPAQPVAATPAAPVQRREAFGPPMAAAFPDAKPGSYTTKLAPNEEPRFQQWVKANRVPWQDTPDADYDMRGYWKAKFSGDPIAKQAANLHFPDPWKTPYHHTFSNESKYATADAPRWHKYDRGYRLIDKRGRIIADEPDETPGTQPPAASLQGAPHGPGRAPIQRREPFGPPAPGMLERTERALFGPTTVAGQLAHPVGRTKQTLTGRSKEERQRALERPSPVFADLRKLELEGAFPGQSTAAKAARGAVKGAESGLTGLTSPENVALMVGTAGFAELPAVSALISAGFSAQMLHAAYEKYPELRKKIEAGDVEGAAETAVDMGVDTLFGIGSLKHTAGGIGRVAERVGERLAEPPSKPKPKVYEGSAAGLSFPREATEGDQLPPKEAYPAVFQAAKLRYRVLRAQGVKLQEAANRVKEEFPILFGRKPVPTEETPAGEAPKSDAEALSDAAKQIRERLEEIIPSVEPPAPPGEGEPGLEPTAAEEEQPPAEAGAAPPAEKPPEPPSAEKEPAKEEKPPEPPKAEEPAKAPEPKPEPPVPGKKETPQAVLDRLKAADATKLSPEEHKDLAKAYVAAAKAATPEVKEKLTDAFTALDDAFKKAQKAPAATGEPAKPEPKEPKGKTPTAIVKYLDEATAAVSSLTPERFNEIVKTGIAATNKATPAVRKRLIDALGRLQDAWQEARLEAKKEAPKPPGEDLAAPKEAPAPVAEAPAAPEPKPEPPAPAAAPEAKAEPPVVEPKAEAVAPESAKAPEPKAPDARDNPQPPDTYGRDVTVKVPGEDTKYEARYGIREAEDVHPSHDPIANYEPNPDFEHVNQRDYKNEPHAQAEIGQQAGPLFDTDYLVKESPTAEHGATVIDPRGNALGGNRRSIIMRLVYALHPQNAARYREALKAQAYIHGIPPEVIDRFKNPILVRELKEVPGNIPDAIADFNKEAPAKLTPGEQAVSDGRRMSKRTLNLIARLMSDVGEESTLAQAIAGDNGGQVINSMVQDGILTKQQVQGLVDERGHLTDAAKIRIADMLVGSLFESPSDFNETPPELHRKLQRSAPHILRTEERPGWEISHLVRQAINLLTEMKARGIKDIDDVLRQPNIDGKTLQEEKGYDPRSIDIARTLKKNPNAMAGAFRLYANNEMLSREGAPAGLWEPPSQESSFEDSFGVKAVKPAEAALGFLGTQYLDQLWQKHVDPILRGAATAGKDIGKAGYDTLKKLAILTAEVMAPRQRSLAEKTGAGKRGLNLAMEMKGGREEQLFKLEAVYTQVKRILGQMPQAQQIDMMDRIKEGRPQATPELQQVVDSWRLIEDRLYNQVLQFKPDFPYHDNHFRVIWKTIPAAEGKLPIGTPTKRGYFSRRRRPLAPKGFMQKATLINVSEGIARGGVPISYNPQVLFEASVNDMMRYITAQRMWEGAKGSGLLKFDKRSRQPDGFVPLDDAISKNWARVYYGQRIPDTNLARITGSTVAKSGEWFVEESFGRLLNNYLSIDKLRDRETWAGTIGSGILAIKNIQTAWELGFSPFHALFETMEAWSSEVARGMTRAWNQGVVQRNPRELAKGIGEILKSPAAPYTRSRLGGSLIRYVANPQQFLATARGADFIKAFPDAERLIADLFQGGGKLTIHDDFRIDSVHELQEADKRIRSGQGDWHDWRDVGLHYIPAVNEILMKPLFNTYIPRLKVGFFLKEYSQQLEQNDWARQRGQSYKDRPTLAREVWDRVENRFGEMNFDNLFWDRTFKSALQVLYRSVTWWLGNMRAIGGGAMGQGREFRSAFQEKRLPYADPGMVWATLAITATSAAVANIMQAFHGQGPATNPKDVIHPRIGGVDDRGRPLRINMLTYLRTYESLVKDFPRGALASAANAMQSMTSSIPEVWQNRDYQGNYVTDPDAPAMKRWLDDVFHVIGGPFSFQSARRAYQFGASPLKAAEMFLLTKAPGDVDSTPAERLLDQYSREGGFREKPKQVKERQEKMRLERAIRAGGPGAEEAVNRAVEQGLIKPGQVRDVLKQGGISEPELRPNYLITGFKRLGIKQAINVWNAASPEEKEWLRDAMELKERLIYKEEVPEQERIRSDYEHALAGR